MQHDQLNLKINQYMHLFLKLGKDIVLDPETSLIEQVGLDSIEAFDAIATLHEILEVSVPSNFNPKIAATLNGITEYLLTTYSPEIVDKFMQYDFANLEKGNLWAE
jgi:acyl carrier protein